MCANVYDNNIRLWLYYLLLISCAGCAKTREEARELKVLKQIDVAIELELSQADKSLQKDKVLVAMFLDTEETENSTRKATYKCYSCGRGGYSGIKRVPYGTPWVIWERVRSNDFKKEIIIDPGPPYKNVTRIVNLIPGEVTNLGRIVLEKVEAEGTVSISGIVKDEDGEPLESVEVSSEKGVVTTNAEGYYRIDGLGLEVCDLEATKEGYISNNAEVSIRNMDKRIIEQDFVLSFPRRIRLRYMISPRENDDFHGPKATGGTAEFFIGEKFLPVPVDDINNADFREFVNRVHLKFRVNYDGLTLSNFYAPIFYQRLRSSSTKFETVNRVGRLNYNSQHCPAIQEGDIILINGGQISNYTVKILFERIERIYP